MYLDFQNILAFKNESNPDYLFKRNADNSGFETTDGNTLKIDGSNAVPQVLPNVSATVVPSIGIVFEF